MALIHLTQYMRPDGHTIDVATDVPDEIAKLAEGLELSCEHLTTGHVMLYARRKGADEDTEDNELARNTGGIDGVHPKLAILIRRVAGATV